MQVQTSGHQFDDLPSAPGAGDSVRRRFFRQALDAVRRVPGVKQAAFTSALPLSGDPSWVTTYGAQFENDDPAGGYNVTRYAVSPDYCQTMGIPLLSGRCIDENDTVTSPQAALISASLARAEFHGQESHRQASARRPHQSAVVCHRRRRRRREAGLSGRQPARRGLSLHRANLVRRRHALLRHPHPRRSCRAGRPRSKTPSGPSTRTSPSSASPPWTRCSPSPTRSAALS